MKKVNWKVRLRSKTFLMAAASLIGMIVVDMGVMDLGDFERYVDAVLLVLMAAGVVVDPTTSGLKDSEQALSYEKPRKDV